MHDAVKYHLIETGGIFKTLDELLIRQKVSVAESRVCTDCKLEWKVDLNKINGVVRLSEIVCLWSDNYNKTAQFPSLYHINNSNDDLHLIGFEHDGRTQTGTGNMFNMILSDKSKSNQSFSRRNTYFYYLPPNKRITAVTIYYVDRIDGFRF